MPEPCGGNTGSLAGCGFAVHFLRAFLSFEAQVWGASIRMYVDDIALSFAARLPRLAVGTLGLELSRLKQLMAAKEVLSKRGERTVLLAQCARS